MRPPVQWVSGLRFENSLERSISRQDPPFEDGSLGLLINGRVDSIRSDIAWNIFIAPRLLLAGVNFGDLCCLWVVDEEWGPWGPGWSPPAPWVYKGAEAEVDNINIFPPTSPLFVIIFIIIAIRKRRQRSRISTFSPHQHHHCHHHHHHDWGGRYKRKTSSP